MLGLPDGVQACLFDMDGVLTRTATLHAAAWKQMFDEFLTGWSKQTSEPSVAFTQNDYEKYVDGRPRTDGTRTFLASRGITLPEGTPTDPPGTMTVQGLSNRKNELVQHILVTKGVEVFPGSIQYLKAARAAGLHTAVVSSSANTQQVLQAAGITDQFEACVDGLIAVQRGLAGKPAPDMFLAGAAALNVKPQQAAVFEDALAGVAAGRAGDFAVVIGVDRVGQAGELLAHGADVVVNDLADLLERK